MAKRGDTVIVTMLGDYDSRKDTQRTAWAVQDSKSAAMITYAFDGSDERKLFDGAPFRVEALDEAGNLRAELVHSRDFGAALAVARRMLGVRS